MKSRNVEIIAAADRALKELLVRSAADIDVELIAEALNASVLEKPLRSAEAMLVRRGKRAVIYIDPSVQLPGRRRFSIAHEIGHLCLHRELSQAGFCLDTEGSLEDYTNSTQELEANRFAAHLLMPGRLFSVSARRVDISITGVQRLAEEYTVSLTAAAWRFIEEVREDCLLVCSHEGRIRWYHKNFYDGRFGVPQIGSEVPAASDAWEVARGRRGNENPDRVDSWHWLSGAPTRQPMFEQSLALGASGLVLTMLHMPEMDEDDEE